MRRDMSKILVERERIKSYNAKDPFAYRFVPNQGWDEDCDDNDIRSEKMSLRKPHKIAGFTKQLNENLAPLQRFLRSRVGRKWNDVYSEIRSQINVNNAVQLHILQHLEHYVKTNTQSEYRYGYERAYMFFVDEDGYLRKSKQQKKINTNALPKPNANVIFGYEIGDKRFPKSPVYAKMKNIWFKVSWKEAMFSVYDRENVWGSLCKYDWKYKEFSDVYSNALSQEQIPRFGGIAYLFPTEKRNSSRIYHYRDSSGELKEATYTYTENAVLKPSFENVSRKELRQLKRMIAERDSKARLSQEG